MNKAHPFVDYTGYNLCFSVLIFSSAFFKGEYLLMDGAAIRALLARHAYIFVGLLLRLGRSRRDGRPVAGARVVEIAVP